MIEGYVTFCWPDGYLERLSFFHGLKGIQHKRERPISYVIRIITGTAEEVEIERLNQWLLQLPSALVKPWRVK